jgi:hypothetical protein
VLEGVQASQKGGIMDWKIAKKGDGYVVTWGGQEWGMEPRSASEADAYMHRLEERYPEGGQWLVDGVTSQRTRGGPWRYAYADGETEVIRQDRLEDAKDVLRHRLGRKTLPPGLTWTLEVHA